MFNLAQEIDVNAFRLIRTFNSRERAHQFQRGKLYMSALASFWWGKAIEDARAQADELSTNEEPPLVKLGKRGDAQRDAVEGATITVAPDDIARVFPEFEGHIAYWPRLIADGYRHCNLLCFSRQEVSEIGGQIMVDTPVGNDDFGDWIAVVDDPRELLARVFEACEHKGFDYVAGPVVYENPKSAAPDGSDSPHVLLVTDDPIGWEELFPGKEPSFEGDAFVKSKRYEAQREWRICLFRGERDQRAYKLRVGDLSDIVHVVQRKNLDADALRTAASRSSWLDGRYFGSVSRDQMRQKFYELGNRKVIPSVAFG